MALQEPELADDVAPRSDYGSLHEVSSATFSAEIRNQAEQSQRMLIERICRESPCRQILDLQEVNVGLRRLELSLRHRHEGGCRLRAPRQRLRRINGVSRN